MQDGVYSVQATGGTISVRRCQFTKADHHVQLGMDVAKAILEGNIMTNPLSVKFDIDNHAKASVVANNLV
jgi:hypothetical protein